MNANDVIVDLLEDNRRRLRRVMGEIDSACLHWAHERGANSIAVTVWHMGRLFDVFLTQQAKGEPSDNECWISRGWAASTGYDPRGVGRDGWGSVIGYTLEEVAAIPRFAREQLLAYFDDVHHAAKDYVSSAPMKKLLLPGAGFEGRFSRYQCIQMALMDNTRHLGEISAIKAMWERRNQAAPPSDVS